MTQFADLVAQVTQKNHTKRGIKLKDSDVDRLSADLQLTSHMKPVVNLLCFDPEHDSNEIKCLFIDNLSDDNIQDASTSTTEADFVNDKAEIQTSFINLKLKNEDGNTVLHCITLAMKTECQDEDTYMTLFDAIISSAYIWWCQSNQSLRNQLPTDGKTKLIYKRKAVLNLTTQIRNSDGLSALELAFLIGATQVVETLLMMEGVNCTPIDATGLQKFDIEFIIPEYYPNTDKMTKMSCLDHLLSDPKNLTSEIFNLTPMKVIATRATGIMTIVYLALTVCHIGYMVALSYLSTAHLEDINGKTGTTNHIIFIVIAPFEPLVVLLFAYESVKKPWKRYCLGDSTNKGIIEKCMTCMSRNHLVILTIPFFSLIVATGVHTFIRPRTGNIHYLTSVTLLYGWLMTFVFALGIKDVHFFLKVIWQMILQNMRQIILVYAFFLLAFSLAIHVQFLASDDISKTYKTPFHTMFMLFNLMMGIGELFDEEGQLEQNLEEGGVRPLFTKLLYIAYTISVTVILLNLLISMMNKSYSRIRQEHSLSWGVQSIQLARRIEGLNHFWFKHGPMFDDTPDKNNNYLVVQHDQNSRGKARTMDEIEESIMERMQTADAKLNHFTVSNDSKLNLLIEILAQTQAVDNARSNDYVVGNDVEVYAAKDN